MRAIYLKHHLDKIRPFITPAVAKMVQDKATAAQAKVSNELPPEPVQEQPSQVTGTLRWVGQGMGLGQPSQATGALRGGGQPSWRKLCGAAE